MSRAGRTRSELTTVLERELREAGTLGVLHSQAIADRLGINPTDLECLGSLEQTGRMSAGRLAELTGLTTGAITGLLDRLEAAGYVRRERDPGDRRRVIVEPLRERLGREIAPLFAPMARAMAELYSGYSEKELAVLVDFATRCNEVMRTRIRWLREQAEAGPKPG